MLVRRLLAHLPEERPLAILICGLPGSGKSWLARRLLPHLHLGPGAEGEGEGGAVHLRTDQVRRELFPQRRYTPEESEATYRELLRRARAALLEGRSVILDGTYLVTRFREEVYQMVRSLGLPLVVILATAPEEAIKERFARRVKARAEGEEEEEEGEDLSEANYLVYLEMKEKLAADPEYGLPSAAEVRSWGQDIQLLVVDTELGELRLAGDPHPPSCPRSRPHTASVITSAGPEPGSRSPRGAPKAGAETEAGLDGLYRLFAELEAVIFDMDGVMVRSEEAWIRSEREFLESRGIRLGEAGWRDFQLRYATYLAGRNQAEAARFYQQVFGLPEPVEAIRRERMALVRRYFAEVGLMPGVRPLIEALYEGGLKLGVASGSPMELIELVLRRHDLGRFFQAVISGDQLHEGKPNPAIYLLAARELGAEPSRCLVFEDAPNGVRAAAQAGMHCVYLPNPALPWAGEVPADFTIKSFEEIDLERLKLWLSRARR